MVLEQEWLLLMAEKFLPVEEQKEERDLQFLILCKMSTSK